MTTNYHVISNVLSKIELSHIICDSTRFSVVHIMHNINLTFHLLSSYLTLSFIKEAQIYRTLTSILDINFNFWKLVWKVEKCKGKTYARVHCIPKYSLVGANKFSIFANKIRSNLIQTIYLTFLMMQLVYSHLKLKTRCLLKWCIN